MKYNLQAINRYSNGFISIDYRQLDDSGQYLGSVGNDSNLPTEVKKEIYESIERIESLLNKSNRKLKMNKYEEMDKAHINDFCEKLTEALLRGKVDLVAEIKCADGQCRNRPLIDVVTALAIMEETRKEMIG